MEKIIERGTVREAEQGKTFDNGVRLLIQLAENFPKGVRFEHVYAGSDDEGIQAVSFPKIRAYTNFKGLWDKPINMEPCARGSAFERIFFLSILILMPKSTKY